MARLGYLMEAFHLTLRAAPGACVGVTLSRTPCDVASRRNPVAVHRQPAPNHAVFSQIKCDLYSNSQWLMAIPESTCHASKESQQLKIFYIAVFRKTSAVYLELVPVLIIIQKSGLVFAFEDDHTAANPALDIL